MKIVHIVYGLEFGGIETMLVNIVNEQVKTGNEISVVIINNTINNNLYSAIDNRVKVYCLGRPVGSKNPYYILKFNYRINKISPDIIHIHTPSIIRYFLPFVKYKMCVTKHDVHKEQENRFLSKYSHIYSISTSVKDYLLSATGVKSKVIYNGIDIDGILSKNRPYSPDKVLKLVQVGRLYHTVKGQDVLIEAVKIIKLKGGDVHLYLIGDGPSREYIENLISKNDLNKNITLLGAKSQQYIFEHLCEYDLFVQPSINEGFGLTVAEAMAAKLPVLISENQGPLEIIDNGKYGFSFKNGDSNDCANKIMEIIERGFDEKMIENGYARVKELFSIEQTANSYIEEYKKILG
ncbi:MAG: glycosyltransferase family 4 protein [Bacteroidales bacterium]|nr:glycosyltransferase family 4 protein [Bacteroidales bacterium]